MKPPPSPHDPAAGDPLEIRLHRAPPAPPGAALMARLQAARPETETRIRPFPWRSLTAIAAALVLGGVAWKSGGGRPGPAHFPALPADPASAGNTSTDPGSDAGEKMAFFPSLESRQQLLTVTDLGVVRDSRQRAVRLMSTTWLDENTYGEPGTEPALRESRFRHEIVPVLLPTY